MKLGFIFGKNWKLSLAELLAYFEKKEIKWNFIDLTKKALIVEIEVSTNKIINELGGILKIVKINEEFDFKNLKTIDFKEAIDFPISVYGSYKLLHDIRKIFHVIPKDGVLSVRDKIRKKWLYETALIVNDKNKCYYGEVIAYYNPYAQKRRDESRPFKDYLTIAPSRAMILINLSQAKKNLLDPFCGMGTIAQEAIVLGIKNIYISDVNKEVVKKAKKNLKWAQQEYEKISVHAKVMDARNLDYKGIEAIATEPDLGPALKEKPNKRDAEKISKYVEKLYKQFFNSAYKILKKDARIAIIFPVFNTKGGKVFINKFFPGFEVIYPFDSIPKTYKESLKLTNPFIIDEQREKGKLRNVIREFCIYKVKKKSKGELKK